MRISGARCAHHRHGGRRTLAAAAAIPACVAVVLALAAPAWASVSATGTLAPIGSGSYLLTVTNTGTEAITDFLVIPNGFVATEVAPSPACQSRYSSAIRWIDCSANLAPAASTQMCFSGHAPQSSAAKAFLRVGGGELTSVSPAAPVASCPVPLSAAGSGSLVQSAAPGVLSPRSSAPATSPKASPRWSQTKCKSTYKAWAKKHKHATRSQKKTEAKKLHKTHGCSLSLATSR